VAAKNSGGTGEQSGYASATTLLARPSDVSVVAASSTSVIISWTAVSGAVEYYIYYSTTGADGVYDNKLTTPASITGTSHTVTGLSPNVSYHYKVAAKNAVGGESEQSTSASATTRPAFPSEVSAVAASSTSVTISWSAVSGAVEYYIYRSSTESGEYVNLRTTPATEERSYTDIDLPPNTRYYYKVAAKNSGGIGEQSSAAPAITLLATPQASAEAASTATSITISWNTVSGAVEYYIYRSSSESGEYDKLTTTPAVITGTSYTDTGLNSNTRYYYKVAAKNAGNESRRSSAVSAVTIQPGSPSVNAVVVPLEDAEMQEPEPLILTKGQSAVIRVQGQWASYRWYVNGSQVATTSTYTFTTAAREPGVWTVMVVVTDAGGAKRSAWRRVIVTN
jgi:hypothetical protein